jgi:hypothetical protein
MPCLLVLLALFLPRVVIVLLWLFTTFFNAVDNAIIGILGFIFMPYTLLAYALAMNGPGSISGVYLILMIVAVIADIASWGGGGHRYSRRTVVVRE